MGATTYGSRKRSSSKRAICRNNSRVAKIERTYTRDLQEQNIREEVEKLKRAVDLKCEIGAMFTESPETLTTHNYSGP